MIIGFAMIFIWLRVLPRISHQPRVMERLQRLDAKGIDASAMFYTELPCMDEILERRGVR